MLPVIHITQGLTETRSVSFGEPSSDSILPQASFKGYRYLGCLILFGIFLSHCPVCNIAIVLGTALTRTVKENRHRHIFRDVKSPTLYLLLPEGGGRWRSPAQVGSLCQEECCVLGSGVLCRS